MAEIATRRRRDDAFRALHLENTATASEVRSSYKALARRHHPDRAGGERLRFQRIRAAEELLLRPRCENDDDAQSVGDVVRDDFEGVGVVRQVCSLGSGHFLVGGDRGASVLTAASSSIVQHVPLKLSTQSGLPLQVRACCVCKASGCVFVGDSDGYVRRFSASSMASTAAATFKPEEWLDEGGGDGDGEHGAGTSVLRCGPLRLACLAVTTELDSSCLLAVALADGGGVLVFRLSAASERSDPSSQGGGGASAMASADGASGGAQEPTLLLRVRRLIHDPALSDETCESCCFAPNQTLLLGLGTRLILDNKMGGLLLAWDLGDDRGDGNQGGVVDYDNADNDNNDDDNDDDDDDDDDESIDWTFADNCRRPLRSAPPVLSWSLPTDRPVYCVAASEAEEVPHEGVASSSLGAACAGSQCLLFDSRPRSTSARSPSRLLHTLAHDDTLQACAFSPTGALIATAGGETVAVWSTRQGTVHFLLKPRQQQLCAMNTATLNAIAWVQQQGDDHTTTTTTTNANANTSDCGGAIATGGYGWCVTTWFIPHGLLAVDGR